MTSTFAERARTEVHEFHDTLARWLASGRPPDFLRLERSQHPDLRLITLDGQSLTRDGLLEQLRGAGGAAPELRIDTDDVEVRAAGSDWALVCFIETHRDHGPPGRRRTTALLTATMGGNVTWRHVHETAIGDGDHT